MGPDEEGHQRDAESDEHRRQESRFGRWRSPPAHRDELRQAKAFALWAATTVMNAAPEAAAAGRAPSGNGVARVASRSTQNDATKAAIDRIASVGPSTPKARRSDAAVEKPPCTGGSLEQRGARGARRRARRPTGVGADVEGKDLEHPEGERDAAPRQRPDHERA